jgi:uncharacterized protein Yka (UPF0111/DUF47 family)
MTISPTPRITCTRADRREAADKITHEPIDLLHKTFITPLDRDEIHKLITPWTTSST